MMYKKILVPTDGSEFAKKAQKHALFLASVSGAEIVAVSVTENNFVNGLPLDDEIYQLNQVLNERSEEENIDLIVMGSSGKSGFDRFIMGSVADKVVNSAKCAVLVVH